jgi:AcrR family transcriptional regulator
VVYPSHLPIQMSKPSAQNKKLSSPGVAPTVQALASSNVLALPTKQARAERTRDRLLEAGTRLLAKGSLDEVSVAQIAREAGCSVGVFYFRFQDKDAYFRFLLDGVFEEIQTGVSRDFSPSFALERQPAEVVALCIDHFVALMTTHQGLIRAAQKQTMHNSESWQPVRAMGRWLVDQYVALIALSHGRAGDSSFEHNARTGLQIVAATLVNAVLVRPPLLNLESPDLAFWLNQVARSCLDVKNAPRYGLNSLTTSLPPLPQAKARAKLI